MSESNWNSLKSRLLKSGLPLESEVADLLGSLAKTGLQNLGSYSFERKESEEPLSVDFHAINLVDFGEGFDKLRLMFFIECKYATKGTGWFFAKAPSSTMDLEFIVSSMARPDFDDKYDLFEKRAVVNNLVDCEKGIEIYGNGHSNDRTITEGLHQLMFASASYLYPILRSSVVTAERKEKIHALICPILVTTASLFILKRVKVSEFEASNQIVDVADQTQALLYASEPPSYVSRYMTEDLYNRFNASGFEAQELASIKSELDTLSVLFPSRFYVVTLDKLVSFINEFTDYYRNELKPALKITL